MDDDTAERDAPKHDTKAHLLAGALGIYAPGCPRCERDGEYVSPTKYVPRHRAD